MTRKVTVTFRKDNGKQSREHNKAKTKESKGTHEMQSEDKAVTNENFFAHHQGLLETKNDKRNEKTKFQDSCTGDGLCFCVAHHRFNGRIWESGLLDPSQPGAATPVVSFNPNTAGTGEAQPANAKTNPGGVRTDTTDEVPTNTKVEVPTHTKVGVRTDTPDEVPANTMAFLGETRGVVPAGDAGDGEPVTGGGGNNDAPAKNPSFNKDGNKDDKNRVPVLAYAADATSIGRQVGVALIAALVGLMFIGGGGFAIYTCPGTAPACYVGVAVAAGFFVIGGILLAYGVYTLYGLAQIASEALDRALGGTGTETAGPATHQTTGGGWLSGLLNMPIPGTPPLNI